MNNLFKILLAIATILMLSGCGKPTLDTSSDETMKESVQKIMTDLSKEDQERFKKTLTGIYMGTLASLDGDAEDAKEEVNENLHGKTAEEVFQYADELKQKMENK
ncbi:DUF6694 family lipoprotein [Salinivibrio sp. IB282]|uniref:DUF6694 family lipoprotein n=1 Tax=Salinivibrio sp. IB282 TaxID=1766122 RepID=UPI0009887C61|nr:DUF6694 family lipoprotein [Salinivibrio sp. IB282]OOE57263.1 hypothetical protein BZG14_15135 [Salinivibrio sp. IB282]